MITLSDSHSTLQSFDMQRNLDARKSNNGGLGYLYYLSTLVNCLVNHFVLLKEIPSGYYYIQRREIKIFLSQNKCTVSVLNLYTLKRNSPQTMSIFISSGMNNVCHIYRLKRNIVNILANNIYQATTNKSIEGQKCFIIGKPLQFLEIKLYDHKIFFVFLY